jgi:uncharacterized protein
VNAKRSTIVVHVTWITPEAQAIVPVTLVEGASVADAIEASGLVAAYALDMGRLTAAVFGRRRTLSDRVHDGERVDLLRPLVVDPKEARRQRARRAPLPQRPPRRRSRVP